MTEQMELIEQVDERLANQKVLIIRRIVGEQVRSHQQGGYREKATVYDVQTHGTRQDGYIYHNDMRFPVYRFTSQLSDYWELTEDDIGKWEQGQWVLFNKES